MSYEAEATYKTALKVWWAMTWRMLPLALAGGIAVGVVMAFTATFLGLKESEAFKLSSGIGGLAVGLLSVLFVIRRLMTKGFGRYRLAVVVK